MDLAVDIVEVVVLILDSNFKLIILIMIKKLSVLGVLAVIFMAVISCYNGMVSSDEVVNEKWANVQTEYQRRADLIPNLVNTVKGYANHEKNVLEAVINARAKATQMTIDISKATPEQIKQFSQAQGELSAALGRLMAVSERYPELKADKQFAALMTELESAENRISYAREEYNRVVKDYNIQVRSFPGNIVASIFSFSPRTPFEADAAAQNSPNVSFD